MGNTATHNAVLQIILRGRFQFELLTRGNAIILFASDIDPVGVAA
jgi:hypothetical protein